MDWTRRVSWGSIPPPARVERSDLDPRLARLPEGSLYAAGGMVFFSDDDVREAAKILAAKGIDCSSFESRAAIIRHARNEYPAKGDDLAGYYEDFPR